MIWPSSDRLTCWILPELISCLVDFPSSHSQRLPELAYAILSFPVVVGVAGSTGHQAGVGYGVEEGFGVWDDSGAGEFVGGLVNVAAI